MKYIYLAIGIFLTCTLCVRADTAAFAQCGTYDSYILLYKSTQKFEELGKLRCGESVQITYRDGDFSRVRTLDGRLGWVASGDLSATPPPPQPDITFGLTELPKSNQKSDPPADQPASQPITIRPNESAPLLTNVSVMKMTGARMSPDATIAKINASRCDFDTSPAALHRLKLSGVSDRIILAMMHAPAAFPSQPPDAQSVELAIPDQTRVEVALSADVSSDGLQEGSIVEMFVVHDVALNGVTVFSRGAEARARIMAVRRSGLGTSGQVVWFMQDVTAANGDHIPATFAPVQDGKMAVGNFAGYPYFLTEFRKGTPVIAASSDQYVAVVDGNIALRVPRPSGTNESASKPQAPLEPQGAPAGNVAPIFPAGEESPGQQAIVKP